jgi:isopentenyl diphosphate isomerase/L-lactate dehydrogenase-like FMN-dependent dehydrogenase
MAATEFRDLAELEGIATARWTSGLRSFIQGGAGSGGGVRANRSAHARWSLRSRVLVDVSSISISTTVLGVPIGLPVLIAPSGLHTLVLPEGEVATAQGAREANTVMVLSSGTGRTIQDVTAAGGNVWFQLYLGSDRGQARRLIDLAGEGGCQALCLTADMPVPPLLGPEFRDGLAGVAHARPQYLPARGEYAVTGVWDHDQRLSWRDLDWLRDVTDLPIVIKGIMTAEDALMAAESGVDGIVVSNHGGRALDTPVGTMDVLPLVAQALNDANANTEIYVDGGFRHGGEVLAALALGARAVLVGRPALWALAVGGAQGVTSMLDTIGNELASTMARTGSTTVACIDASRVSAVPR